MCLFTTPEVTGNKDQSFSYSGREHYWGVALAALPQQADDQVMNELTNMAGA